MVLIAAVVANLVLGVNYSWSIVSKQLVVDYGWSSVDATLPYTVAVFMTALFTFAGGVWEERVSPRVCETAGALLVGVGLFWCGAAETSPAMVLGFGILKGAGGGLCAASTTVIAIKWFPPEKKGLVSGLCLAAAAFSSALWSPVFQVLAAELGLQRMFYSTAVAAALLLMLCAQAQRVPPPEPAERPSSRKPLAADDLDWRGMVKTAAFYKLWGLYILGATAGLLVIGNVAGIVLHQANVENGAVFVTLLAVSNGAGRFAMGSVSDVIGVKAAFRIILPLQMLNMLLFTLYTTPFLLAAGCALAGFTYGGMVSLIPAASTQFGMTHLPENYAIVNTGYGVGGIIGPTLAAWSVDMTGEYQLAYQAAALLSLAAFLLTFFQNDLRAKRRPPGPDKPAGSPPLGSA